MPSQSSQKKWYQRDHVTSFIVCIAFVVLALLLTYPVIRDIEVDIAGMGSDTHYTLSKILNNAARLEDLGAAGAILDTIKNVRMDPITIHTALYFVFGEPLGYNLFWLFSYVFSGFGAYVLVREILVGRRGEASEGADRTVNIPWTIHAAAFLGGIVYAFHPAHVAWSLGFAGSTHTEWIPLATYALLRFIRNPRFHTFAGFVILLLLLVQGENHFAAFYAAFLPFFLAFYLFQNREVFRNRRFLAYSIGAILIGGGVGLFHYFPLLRIATSDANWLDPGLEQATRYSNDLLSAITPAFLHPLWGKVFAPIRELFTGNRVDYSAYIGWTVLTITILLLIRKRTAEVIFWVGIAVLFYVFSMGPYLHVSGLREPQIPLPYLLLNRYVPFFDNIRSVDRFAVIAFLGFAVVAGEAVNTFFERVKTASAKRILFAIVAVFIIFEYLAIPVPTTSIAYSPFYDRIKNEPGDFSIIEIPSSTNYRSAARSTYYQAIHRKPMINTFHFARVNPSDPALVRNQSIPILKELLYELPRDADNFGHSAMDVSDPDANTSVLMYYGVRYIVLHKPFAGFGKDEIRPQDFPRIQNFLGKNLRTEVAYEDEELIAYRVVGASALATPLLWKGEGNWEGPFVDDGESYERLVPAVKLMVENVLEQDATVLSFSARSTQKEQRFLKVELEGKELAHYPLTSEFREFEVVLMPLPAVESTLTLTVTDSKGENDETVKADIRRIRLR